MSVANEFVVAAQTAGADTVFGLPGGGPNLEVIGAVETAGMRFVLAHGETASCIMAATYGLLTGAPGVALVTRGPGAASAVNGAAQATLDRYPLVVLTDCVPRTDADRVAHQRVDQVAMMRPVTKWSGCLGDNGGVGAARDAFRLAGAAPAGAVHLDFDPASPSDCPPAPPRVAAAFESDEVNRARALISSAHRLVAIIGFHAVAEAERVRSVMESIGCPVLTTYQAAGVLAEGHPQLAGLYTSGAIESAVLDTADVVLIVGFDSVEPMPARWRSAATVVSVSSVPATSTFLPTAVELVGPLGDLLHDVCRERTMAPDPGVGAAELAVARARLRTAGRSTFGPVELVDALIAATPIDATVTVDAGAHFLAVMPFWPVRRPLQLLISNGLATMGFAVPAAIGAAFARPGQPGLACVGDGGLGMTLAELETIARYNLPITVVVFNDSALSLIEIKQRDGQGGRGSVRYGLTEFASVARAMGLDAAVAHTAAEVGAALATGWDRPRLIDARIDPFPYAELIRITRG